MGTGKSLSGPEHVQASRQSIELRLEAVLRLEADDGTPENAAIPEVGKGVVGLLDGVAARYQFFHGKSCLAVEPQVHRNILVRYGRTVAAPVLALVKDKWRRGRHSTGPLLELISRRLREVSARRWALTRGAR